MLIWTTQRVSTESAFAVVLLSQLLKGVVHQHYGLVSDWMGPRKAYGLSLRRRSQDIREALPVSPYQVQKGEKLKALNFAQIAVPSACRSNLNACLHVDVWAWEYAYEIKKNTCVTQQRSDKHEEFELLSRLRCVLARNGTTVH